MSMGIENRFLPKPAKKEQGKKMYPERAAQSVEVFVEKWKKLESGEAVKIKLNEAERKEILAFESQLGEELEKIYEIKDVSVTLYPEYFQTPLGRKDFAEIVGAEIEGEKELEIKKWLIRHREVLQNVPAENRADMAGRSHEYMEEKLLQELVQRKTADGSLSTDGISAPGRLNLLLNPGEVLEKIKALRKFKQKIKAEKEKNTDNSNTEPGKAKSKILELYKRRTNEMIASEFFAGVIVAGMADDIDEEGLKDEEKELARIFSGDDNYERNYSRYDKLIFGAGDKFNAKGDREQLSKELLVYARKIEAEMIESELGKYEKIKEKGLDRGKIFQKNVPKEDFIAWEEEILEEYGIKSSYPAAEYDPDRKGPAPDNKWQFVARPAYRSMSVKPKQKVVVSSNKDKAIHDVLAELLGHENSHVVQHVNKEKLSLRLFQKLGGDRRLPFAEGGAMMTQDKVTAEAFGFRTLPHAHYIQAMLRRLAGGDYLDCVQAFYESALKVVVAKKEAGVITDEQFEKQTTAKLKHAINRAKRLFKEGVKFDAKSAVLTRSKDTVYLEQMVILEKLKETGLEKFAFISGVNLDTLLDLAEMDEIATQELKEPPAKNVLKIWDKIKDNYKLEEKAEIR